MPRPEDVIASLIRHGASIATAESVTGGAVCAALVSVPGASTVVRGGIVAYSAAAKASLLGVDPALIRASGLVSTEVALAMARGCREATGASVVVSTTGAAGPDPHDGAPAGRVCLAVVGPSYQRCTQIDLAGDRDAVRAGAVDAALALVAEVLADDVTLM
ncbi:CinA family protein [Demequina sp.]|uniref:CinA family protein n=1 Tax=Demequina sp. TaxID=2050685 RepID=UPI0025E775CF|nr:CinA family protein [Demequina sp.]